MRINVLVGDRALTLPFNNRDAERRQERVSRFCFAPACEIASQSAACGPEEVLVSADLG